MINIEVKKSEDSRRIPFPEPILVAHQPEFLPWLGNISKATMGDVYFILDTVQYQKEYYQNRNKIRIKNNEGWQWLIIPVQDTKKHLLNIQEINIVNNDLWKKKHLRAIEFSYKKSPYFKDIYPEIEQLYCQKEKKLLDFLIPIIKYAFNKFEIDIPVYLVSDLIKKGYSFNGQKSDLVIDMCKVVNAKTFVFGVSGKEYIDNKLFEKAKISVVFQEFIHPQYTQIHGNFIPAMSFIDILFNNGKEAKNILGKSKWTTL